MEAALATIALLLVMTLALVLLARSWPHSSRRTGYRLGRDETSGGGPPVSEDDDARWRWRDR